MVTLAAGAIVLIRLPFSDLSRSKVRPALVLLRDEEPEELALREGNRGEREGGLRQDVALAAPVVLDRSVPVVAEEVEVAIGGPEANLPLSREVGGLQRLAGSELSGAQNSRLRGGRVDGPTVPARGRCVVI